MGFTSEFENMAIEVLGEEDETGLEILRGGDKREMLIHLLERIGLSPTVVRERLQAEETARLDRQCRAAEPLWELLMYLLHREMLFGVSRYQPPTDKDLDDGAVAM